MLFRYKNNQIKMIDDIHEWQWDELNSTPENVHYLNLYKYVPVIKRAINIRANNLASIPYRWYKGNQRIDVPKKLEYFNTQLPSLLRFIEQSLTIFGTAYLLPITNEYGFNPSLETISSQHVTNIYTSTGELSHFQFTAGSVYEKLYQDECVYIWLPSPLYPTMPDVSDLQTAYLTGYGIYNLDAFTQRFFKNGAIRATILKVGSDNPLNPTPTREEVSRLQAIWNRLITGTANAFRNLVFANEVTPITIGEGLEQLDYGTILDKKREDIANAFGIPLSLLYDNASNYATAMQSYLSFYTLTLIPEMTLIINAINEQYLNDFGYSIKAHPEQLEVFQYSELQKAQALMYIRDDTTQNERRQLFGLEPIENVAGAPAPIQEETKAFTSSKVDVIANAIVAFEQEQDELERTFLDQFDAIIERIDKPRDGRGKFVSSGIVERKYILNSLSQEHRAELDTARLYSPRTQQEYEGILEFVYSKHTLERKQVASDLARHRDEYLEKAKIWAQEKQDKRESKSIKLLDTLPYEDNMYTRLLELLSPYLDKAVQAIIAQADFDFTALSDELQQQLLPLMTEIIVDNGLLISEELGQEIDIEEFRTSASLVAEQYTYELVKDLDNTTRNVLQDTMSTYLNTEGMTRQEVEDKLFNTFGVVRARMIASTETTRATAQATGLLQDYYADKYGLIYKRKWNTNADDLVCDICGPNNGKYEDGVTEEIPAHPECRCQWTLELVSE